MRSAGQGALGMQGQKKHIVVVDDEPGIRETIQEYLELHDYRVTAAGGGAELRRAVEVNDVDLVLLDIRMPGEDGLSLARFLRAEKRVGLIMLTAAGDVVHRIVGLEMGADDYLAKPVDLRELLARIKAVLRRTDRAAAGGGGAGGSGGARVWAGGRVEGEEGLSRGRVLRAEKRVGVTMLTAAGEVAGRIVGRERGADDYGGKPVDLRGRLGRRKAVLKRTDRAAAEDESEPPEGTRL